MGICLFMVVIVLNDMTSLSNKILHIAPVTRRDKSTVTFIVARWFPLQIKFVYFLRILCLYQLCQELKLLAKFEDRLLKDSYFTWRPFLKYKGRSHRIYQDVQVSFFVEVIHSVKIEFDWLLLLFRISFVHFSLRCNHLEDGSFFRFECLQHGSVRMVFGSVTSID